MFSQIIFYLFVCHVCFLQLSSATIEFTRNQKGDSFESGNKCPDMSFESVFSRCTCNYELTFFGNKCKKLGTECQEKNLGDVKLKQNHRITVLDYDENFGDYYWNVNYNVDIKRLMSSNDATEMEKKLQGMVLKFQDGDECTVVKVLGLAKYPVDLSHLLSTETSETTKDPVTTAVQGEVTDTLPTLTNKTIITGNQMENSGNEEPENMLNSNLGVIVSAAAALSLVIVVTLSFLLYRRRKLKEIESNSRNIESPFEPDVSSEYSVPIEPTLSSPALSRHSFETVMTEDGGNDFQQEQREDENIYNLPEDVMTDKQRYSGEFGMADNLDGYYNTPEANYNFPGEYDDPNMEPEYRELEPEYRELEPELYKPSENKAMTSASSSSSSSKAEKTKGTSQQELYKLSVINVIKENTNCGAKNLQQKQRPVPPRKPTALQSTSILVEDDDDYYSEAIAHSKVAEPNIEELYATVDKSQKGK